MNMSICNTLEEVNRLCKPMKIYDPNTMEWYVGRIWKKLDGTICTISEAYLEEYTGLGGEYSEN